MQLSANRASLTPVRSLTRDPARILIVEDERIVALDISTTLTRLGYEVVAFVATGEEAIDVALTEKPDLVMMDIRLAGAVDGVKASESIVAKLDVPIIFLTAHSDNETLKRVQSSNPYSYILKPFRTDDLRCAIEVTLNRHAADRELRIKEKWLRTTFETMRDGVITTDQKNNIQFINPVAAAMTGYGYLDSIGRNLAEILRLLDAATNEVIEVTSHSTLAGVMDVEAVNGSRWAVEPAAANITGEMNEARGQVIVLRDVSETRKALAEVAKLNASLEALVSRRTQDLKMANDDLQAFTYSLSHDLRAPLRAIDGYVQSVLEDCGAKLSLSCTLRLERARETAQRTAKLIVELLNIARVSQAEPQHEDIDLTAMAVLIGNELKVIYGEKAEYRVQPRMKIEADQSLLTVILANLIGNAWKFSAKRETPLVEVGIKEFDGLTAIYVRDNGVGFDASNSKTAIAIFSRLHGDQFSGDGVGLALVDRAVKRMHGRLWVESKPDQGATFYFTLNEVDFKPQ